MSQDLDPAGRFHRAVDHIEPTDRLDDVRAAGDGASDHRRGTRRLVLTAAAVVLAAVGVASAMIATGDDPSVEVAAEGPVTSRPPDPTAAPGGLVVTPSTGLAPGEVVTFRIDPPGSGRPVVTQCAREAVEVSDDLTAPLDLCRPTVTQPRANRYKVSSTVPTPAGPVDCTRAPGRCVLGVSLGGGAGSDNRWAPLSFAPRPVAESPELRILTPVPEGGYPDGGEVRLELRGVSAGSSVQVEQCRVLQAPGYGIAVTEPDGTSGCDQTTGAARDPVEINANGALTMSVRMWADVFDGEAWQSCEPCELRVIQDGTATARVRVPMADTGQPRHPRLAITTPEPHRPGQVVRLEGTDFRRAGDLALAWCRTPPGPAQRAVHRTPDCEWPSREVSVSETGTFEAELALPAAGNRLGQECAARPGACGFASGNAYSSFFAPFDITT